MAIGEPVSRADSPERSTAETFLRACRVVAWVIYAIVVVNAVMLSLAFLLRLLGANPDAGFTEWVYRSADRTMGPFRGMFPDRQVGDDSVLDTSLLFAAAVYIVIALLIDAVLRWLGRRVAAEHHAAVSARSRAAREAWGRPYPDEPRRGPGVSP